MIQHKGIFDEFNLNYDVFKNLIETLCKNYNIVPYHQFSHAFSVFQLLYHCYHTSDLKKSIQKFEFLGSLIAALAHDLNHKGVNNAYKIKKKSAKSLLYFEQSVLENMHSSKFFNILRDSNVDITSSFHDPVFLNFSPKNYVYFRLRNLFLRNALSHLFWQQICKNIINYSKNSRKELR